MRLQRKEVGVLVETAEEWKPAKKPKKERLIELGPSKRRKPAFVKQAYLWLVLLCRRCLSLNLG